MKYYKINVKRFYENNMIATNANGEYVASGGDYFWKMDSGEILSDVPVFDYFHLESFDKKEYWEWMLADVHLFIGEGSQIPGWFISKKLKEVFQKFNLAEPHFYYSSKLLYKAEKLDYYIFQFSGGKFLNSLVSYIDFNKSLYFDPNQNIDFKIINEEDLISQTKRIFKESGFDIINVPIKILALNEDIDFISMQNFLGDKLVSERLKNVIEESGITGFEFSELDYEVVVEIK